MESIIACGKKYRIIKLLGRGKGGYAYLAEIEGRQAVVKKIHHEPCKFYSFGKKMKQKNGIMSGCGNWESELRR